MGQKTELPRIVSIRINHAHLEYRYSLPKEMQNATIDDVIEHTLKISNADPDPESKEFNEKLQQLMKSGYDIRASGKRAAGKDKLGKYFVAEKTEKGQEYLEAEISILNRLCA